MVVEVVLVSVTAVGSLDSSDAVKVCSGVAGSLGFEVQVAQGWSAVAGSLGFAGEPPAFSP